MITYRHEKKGGSILQVLPYGRHLLKFIKLVVSIGKRNAASELSAEDVFMSFNRKYCRWMSQHELLD